MLRRIVLIAALLLAGAAPAIAADTVPAARDQITLTFSPVVKRVVPAVVNIYTRHVEKVESPLLNDPFFRQFMGQGFAMRGMPRERVVQSLGSGVIVAADGTIVTSYHVVEGSDQIMIVLSDRRELLAHVEKVDERSDLAVLKVDAKGAPLPFLELRDSDTLEVGDLVLAVGNPFGVGQTVTSGIISALARSAADVSDYQFFIQTDAAINPGNSGGALVDMQGRLIGINTAIYSRSGGYQGIGFAIPANMVRAVLNGKAGKSGSVIEPWFGVEVETVTQEIADAQGLDRLRGVLVEQVAPKSPAEKAGLRPGDIILSLNGSDVDDTQSLNFRIATAGIGKQVTLTLWRASKIVTLPVTFEATPADLGATVITLRGLHPLNGMKVAALNADIAELLHVQPDDRKVVIVQGTIVGPLGISVQPGDIILAVNDRKINSVDQLVEMLSVRWTRIKLTLQRGDALLNVVVGN